MANALETAVAAHYSNDDLTEAIRAALAASGADTDRLLVDDLAPVDEFHTAGRRATARVFDIVRPEHGARVLDAGSGLGGTARYLADRFGCRVSGVDLTPGYVRAARTLTDWVGLSALCDFEVGSVLDLPFDNRTFDMAATFHVAMNIEDRPGFYSELARVLRPGGRLAVFDIMKGPTAGMRYPVPWAETEATSFLKSPAETRSLLEAAGFRVDAEESYREPALAFFREAAARPDGPPRLSLALLTGANTAEKFGNAVAALDDGQIDPVIMAATLR